MATAAAVERFKAQGKQQLNVWVDSDTAALLKTLATMRSQSYPNVIRDALIALSGQPVATATPATGGDSLDRLSLSVSRLHDEIASVRSIIGDWSSAFESRLSDLQDDLEARLSAVEATINTTPVQPAPGGNEAPGPKPYYSDKKNEIEERRARFIALHNEGLSTTGISHAIRKEGYKTGTSPGEIDLYLRAQGLTPHRMRG